jgi:hypothetical protein
MSVHLVLPEAIDKAEAGAPNNRASTWKSGEENGVRITVSIAHTKKDVNKRATGQSCPGDTWK